MLYEHDCDSCLFLGLFDGADIYVCPQTPPRFIARNSSEPPDYVSYRGFRAVLHSVLVGSSEASAIVHAVAHSDYMMERDSPIAVDCDRGIFVDCDAVDLLFLA